MNSVLVLSVNPNPQYYKLVGSSYQLKITRPKSIKEKQMLLHLYEKSHGLMRTILFLPPSQFSQQL